jgi:hypothetical protein
MTWLRKLGRIFSTGGLSAIFERGHKHEHDIDHEAVARYYHQMLTISQRPLPDLEMYDVDPDVRRWLKGYAAWYDAAVAPLMREMT